MKHRLPAAVATLALLACATPPRKKDVVWPDPPEKARIKFVSAFANEDTLDDSGWNRFKRSILGGEDPARLRQPMGLALSPDGHRMYIADFGAGTVFKADLQAKRFGYFAPDQGFAQPFGVAVDAQEHVYVSDSGARTVTAYDARGEKLWSVGREFERPTGLCLDREAGLLYVVDSGTQASQSHRVWQYDLKGTRLREIGNGRGSEDNQFHFPVYCAVDSAGKLYVGDTMNFRIEVFGRDGQYLGKYGENGDGPGTFARIKGLDFDGFGNLYVADGGHSTVQIFNREWDVLLTFGAFAPFVEYFDIPSCLAIDRKINRIYVCNEHNARINAYDLVNTTAADSVRPRDLPAEAPPPGAAAPGERR